MASVLITGGGVDTTWFVKESFIVRFGVIVAVTLGVVVLMGAGGDGGLGGVKIAMANLIPKSIKSIMVAEFY